MDTVRISLKRVGSVAVALPAYQTEGAAGMDLRAAITEPLTLRSLERKKIPTGIAIALPLGFEAQVRPRSGLAWKQGLTVLNSPGTIDCDYRGEIEVLLVNLSDAPVVVAPGDRIAQMIVAAVSRAELVVVNELADTTRGAGGYGSTGV